MADSIFNNTYTPGFLDEIEERDTIDFLKDVRVQLRETMLKNYEPNKLDQQTEFNAICLKQLKTTSTTGKDIIRIKGRIPELHTMIPIPKSATDYTTISLYPTFMGIANDFTPKVVDDAIDPGTRMTVSFEQLKNFGGPSIVRLFNIKDVNNPGTNPSNRRGRIGKKAKYPVRTDGSQFGRCKTKAPKSKTGIGVIKGKGQGQKWNPDLSKKPDQKGLAILTNYKNKNPTHGVPHVNCKHNGMNNSSACALQAGPAGGVTGKPSVADQYMGILKMCKILETHTPSFSTTKHTLSTCGMWIQGIKEYPEFCRMFMSMHIIGRAFDLGTKSCSLFTDPASEKCMFLVTLSSSPNQTYTNYHKTEGYAHQFFKFLLDPNGGVDGDYLMQGQPGTPTAEKKVRGAFKRKFTVWLKVGNNGKTPGGGDVVGAGGMYQSKTKVTLQAMHMHGKTLNSNTKKQWKGYAINFTKLCKDFGFHRIPGYRGWCIGLRDSDRVKFFAGQSIPELGTKKGYGKLKNINENEWHHFQNHDGLVRAQTTYGDEILRAGYILSELQQKFGGQSQELGGAAVSGWDFYKKAIWTGSYWKAQA